MTGTEAATHLLVELWDAAGLSDAGAGGRGADPRRPGKRRHGAAQLQCTRSARKKASPAWWSWPNRTSPSIPGPNGAMPAVDVFMCGACDPYRAVAVLRETLAPGRVEIAEHRRGAAG